MFAPLEFFETIGQLGSCKCSDCQCKVSVPTMECCRCLDRQCEMSVAPAVDWSSVVAPYDERKEIYTADHVDGHELLITPVPVALSRTNKLAQPIEKPSILAAALDSPKSESEADIQDVTDFHICKMGMTQGAAAPVSDRRLESELSQLTDHHGLIGVPSEATVWKLSAERLVNLAMTLKAPLPELDIQDVTKLDTSRTGVTQSTAAPASARSLKSDVSEVTHHHELNAADSEAINQMLAPEYLASSASEQEGFSHESAIQESCGLDTCYTDLTQSTTAPASAWSLESELTEQTDQPELDLLESEVTKQTLSAELSAIFAPALDECLHELHMQETSDLDICRTDPMQSSTASAIPAVAPAVTPASACNLESELTEQTDQPELDVLESEMTKQTLSAQQPGSLSPALDGCLHELHMQDISDLDTCRADLIQNTTAPSIPAAALAAAPASARNLESEPTELPDQPELDVLESEVTKQTLSAEQPESLAPALDGGLHELHMQDISDLDTCRTDPMQSSTASAIPAAALAAAPASACNLESEPTELTEQPELDNLESEVAKQALSSEQPESFAFALDGPLHEPVGVDSEVSKQTLSADRLARLTVTFKDPLPEPDIQDVKDFDIRTIDLTRNTASSPPQAEAAECSSESELCELTEDSQLKDSDVQVTSQTLSDWYNQDEEDDGEFFEVPVASLKLADVREDYDNFRKFKSTSGWLRDGHPQPSCESESTKTYIVHDTFKRESTDRDRPVLPYPYPYSFK